jgi:hypothetical protein
VQIQYKYKKNVKYKYMCIFCSRCTLKCTNLYFFEAFMTVGKVPTASILLRVQGYKFLYNNYM